MGGVARADAAVVLAEGDIQDPVVGVFDAPVPAHRLQQGTGLGRQAGDETADIGRDPAPAAAFALDPDQAGQVAPLAVGVDMPLSAAWNKDYLCRLIGLKPKPV